MKKIATAVSAFARRKLTSMKDARALKKKLGEANARVSELSVQVYTLKRRLDEVTKVNLSLARRETIRMAQNKELESMKWPVYVHGELTDMTTGETKWAIVEMKVTRSGLVQKVIETTADEPAARSRIVELEAKRDG